MGELLWKGPVGQILTNEEKNEEGYRVYNVYGAFEGTKVQDES